MRGGDWVASVYEPQKPNSFSVGLAHVECSSEEKQRFADALLSSLRKDSRLEVKEANMK